MSIDITKVITSYDLNDPSFSLIADEIQGNILKSHGRGHTSHIFFHFNRGKVQDAKTFIADLVNQKIIFSAKDQKLDTEATKEKKSDAVFSTFYLSKSGYDYLGIPIPIGLKSMKEESVQNKLNDPSVNSWDEGFQKEIHGMILLGWGSSTNDVKDQENRKVLDDKTNEIQALLTSNNLATITSTETGDGIKGNGAGINDDLEHFGYVDGISQPSFFKSDFGGGKEIQLMPPNLVLVPDISTSGNDNAFGSFFVFRKLEQNVKGFKTRELTLANKLKLGGKEAERAGAMVVGRFENGSPIAVSPDDNVSNPGAFNDFDYSQDDLGAKCPFHSHIRKSNPRNEKGVPSDKSMMARRGIIYGKRNEHPNEEPIENMPEGGVGLLFMSFQSNLERQFELIQSSWVNNRDFVDPNTGLDPVIGQGVFGPEHKYAATYGDPSVFISTKPFGGFVTLKGGEYFFAPSMAFLKGLNAPKRNPIVTTTPSDKPTEA